MKMLLPVLYLDGVLAHQRRLLEALARHTATASIARVSDDVLTRPCAVSGASVGQHLRHALDHVRKLVDSSRADPAGACPVVAYDQRARGTDVEQCVASAASEIEALAQALGHITDLGRPVLCRFMFAPSAVATGAGAGGVAAPVTQLDLASTVGRELGFVAHHAIHHNASILGILRSNPDLYLDVLPDLLRAAPDFGTAPSTVVFQHGQARQRA
jgi:hypothetical protein